MKFFIRFFVGLIVLAVASYGYIYYKNKQAVDDVFEMLNMFTSASYGSTYVDLNGQSVTTKIKIVLPGSSTEATIDELSFGSGSLLESFKMVRSLESGQTNNMPSEVNAKFKGFTLPLTSEVVDLMMSDYQEPDLFSRMQFAGCGSVKQLDAKHLFKLGYNQLVMDMDSKIEFDTHINQARWNFYFSAKDYGSANLAFVANGLDMMQLNPQLSSMTLDLNNDGLSNKINTFCAEETGLTEEQFVEQHMNYIKHLFYNEGIYLSEEFYNKYESYVKSPRSIRISSHPSNSTDLSQVMMLSPRLAMSSMNLSVNLNEQEVHQLTGNRPDPSELPQLNDVTAIEETIRTVQGLTLQATAVSSIEDYVGYEAYFNYRGKIHRGFIVSVSGGQARINSKISAGNSMEMPFDISGITNLRVRREVANQ